MDSQITPDSGIAAANMRPQSKCPLSQHMAYVPIISLWTGALLALPLLVMPSAMATGLGESVGLADQSAAILSTLAAGLGALVGFGAARTIAARQSVVGRPMPTLFVDAPIAEATAEPVQSGRTENILRLEDTCIAADDVADEIAGSAIFEVEPPKCDADEIADAGADEIARESEIADPDPAPDLTIAVNFPPWPDAMEQPDAQIMSAAKPAEIAPNVEVEAEAVIVPEAETVKPAPHPAKAPSVESDAPDQATPIGGKAVRQLRSKDVADLNMVQLLERFAVAMDHHRDTADGQQSAAPGHANLSQGRHMDPGTKFYPDSDIDGQRSGVSTRTQAIETENALRNALNDLDRLSGAA